MNQILKRQTYKRQNSRCLFEKNYEEISGKVWKMKFSINTTHK